MTREIRVYGLSEESLRERLAALSESACVAVTLSYNEGRGMVTLTGEQEAVDTATTGVAERLGAHVYSYEGESLATCVVKRLAELGMTVSTAESCTGGMVAAALTDVPGASQVFGTGVVSYSNQCKESLLTVSGDTISVMGAVSAETAGQMARGVRQTGSASVGVSVTGEAGPNPSGNLPVGTVFVALSDKKRTWVEELHLDGADRAVIRRQATDSVLWLLWRYLSAYPAVMAGGENNHVAQKRAIPHTQGSGQPRFLSLLLPWKGDSRRRLIIKCMAWLLAAALFVGVLLGGYQYFVQPHRNLELQESLGDLYWEESTDLTGDPSESGDYPAGMLPVFRGLYDMNEDVAGWLYIPDTGVDYPVMNYADGYYHNHSFLKEYSLYGQPYYGDSSNSTIHLIYGQNTGDGQMFSELLNYRRVAYLQEHSVIECNTIYANKKWQIFAVVVLDDHNPDEFKLPTEAFESDEDYLAYIDKVQERSLFLSDTTFAEQEELLVLSTEAQREYGFANARLAVFARLVKEEATELAYRVNNLVKMPSAMYRDDPTTRITTTTETTETEATTGEEESTTTPDASGTDVEDTTVTTGGTSATITTMPTGDTTGNAEIPGSITATTTTDDTNATDSGTTTGSGTAVTGSTTSGVTAGSTTSATATEKPTTNQKTTGSAGAAESTTATGKVTTNQKTTGSTGAVESTTTTDKKTTTTTTGTLSTAVTTATTASTATGETSVTTQVVTDVNGSVITTESTSAEEPTGDATEDTDGTSVWPTNPTVATVTPGDAYRGEEAYADIGY